MDHTLPLLAIAHPLPHPVFPKLQDTPPTSLFYAVEHLGKCQARWPLPALASVVLSRGWFPSLRTTFRGHRSCWQG